MDLLILDTNLKTVSNFDLFESFIWTDRFRGYGDFEIYGKASEELISTLVKDYYIYSKESSHIMIIEDIKITFDVNTGDTIIVGGRSLESILNRRIIWAQTVLSGSLQDGIQKLLNENVISPTLSERMIPNFVFEASTDTNITSLTIDTQLNRGVNLYEAINNICISYNIGFKISLSEDNKFIFKLYCGKDRSYDQINNPYVVFSPKFENIINSSYLYSTKNSKNVTLVIGEETNDVGIPQKTTVVGTVSSVSRRESYTDASNISQTTDSGHLTDEEYITQLTQKGDETLANNTVDVKFDGQVDTTRIFKYEEDFFIGDVVQLVSDYGIEGKAQIVEMIHSENTQGISTYPTFEMIN